MEKLPQKALRGYIPLNNHFIKKHPLHFLKYQLQLRSRPYPWAVPCCYLLSFHRHEIKVYLLAIAFVSCDSSLIFKS